MKEYLCERCNVEWFANYKTSCFECGLSDKVIDPNKHK